MPRKRTKKFFKKGTVLPNTEKCKERNDDEDGDGGDDDECKTEIQCRTKSGTVLLNTEGCRERYDDDDDDGDGGGDNDECNTEIQCRTKSEKLALTVVQNVRSKNTQLGNENKIYDYTEHASGISEDTELKATCQPYVGVEARPVGNILTQNITAKNVNINIPEPRTDRDEIDSGTEGIQNFLKYVNNFDKGHYVLVVDRQTGLNELEAFALVDWIAVIDFDSDSRISGLLSYVEESISNRRSLHIVNWQEEKCTFSDNSVYWIGIKGNASQPDTKTNDDFQKWKRQIKQSFLQTLKQLKKFGDVYSNFTVVAIWPNESNSKHFHFVLNEMSDALCPRQIVIIDDGRKKSREAVSVFNILTDDFPLVNLDQVGICRAINCVCRPVRVVGSSHYQLPTTDSTNDPNIDVQKAKWLKEDLHVLYLANETGDEYDTEGLKNEELNFFKGGTLPWTWWYQVGPGRVDIQRDLMQDIINYIKSRYISLCRSGCIKLFHNPGSGGTTLSQRIVWALKNDIPCVQLKQQGSSAISDIAEKIEFLFDKTRMPIFVLVDGSDEQKIESLRGILGGHCCVIILYVKRYHMTITDKEPNKHGVFFLKASLSKLEAKNLHHLYSNHCSTDRQRRNIEDLMIDGKCHSVFDFGFAMYSYKYKGIESYVQGHLKLDTNDSQNVQVRQKALAYLSLVYYYGQASLPCKFFAYLLEMDNADDVTILDDIPDDVKELLVRDVQNRRKNVVRVAHHYIAKEILDQVLVYPTTIERALSPTLSTESKRRLGSFAVEFIQKAGKQNQREASSSTVSDIMTRTFILRDDKAVGENETQVTKKRQRFSQILEDATSNSPFTERFNIYQALTDSFPMEAQFKAHLGRLYTHCRPDETDVAEKCFEEAIDICETESLVEYMSPDMPFDDIPFCSTLDLMHIYHMYGNMILKQVAKYTGRYLGDTAFVQTKGNFDETATMLLSKVKHACKLFSKCITVTPIGCEGSFGYIGEIQVRLMFCDYVHRNSGFKGGIVKYINANKGEVVTFVNECIPIVDELFLSCLNNIETEKMDRNVRNCINWHSALFNISAQTDRRIAKDAMSRRLEIAKVKMKYCQPDSYGILEHVNDEDDVIFIVQELEKNFKDYENKGPETLPTKRAMDLDYREWLVAIRHILFKEDYAVDRVLQQVQLWHDTLHTPYSLFYLFVLKSLHGMGNSNSQGDAALLLDAQITKDEMLKRSKYVTKPRYPREWLGKSQNNIRQLVSGLRFFGQVEGRDIKIGIETLEIQKGTICAPNDKPAGGYIDLDLGPDNRVPLKVFFVPARSEGNLQGPSYTNARVEFVIGFSLSHGYEAFNVKPIEHQKCTKCKENVEKRTCDTEVQCPRCRIWIPIEAHKKQAKQSRNGTSKTSTV